MIWKCDFDSGDTPNHNNYNIFRHIVFMGESDFTMNLFQLGHAIDMHK